MRNVKSKAQKVKRKIVKRIQHIELPLRQIYKKNERQAGKLFDVLMCHHSVPVTKDVYENTYRRFRGCPVCHRDLIKKKLAVLESHKNHRKIGLSVPHPKSLRTA